MSKYLFCLFVTLSLALPNVSRAQTLDSGDQTGNFYVRQIQQPVVNEKVEQYMKLARSQMDEGHYEDANITFRKILSLNEVLPTNLSYLFAETLFMIGQYENSQNFLDKYLSLSGKAGDYYEQSLELEQLLQAKKDSIISCELCNRKGYRLTPCLTCMQTGKTIQTCHYCRGKGLTTCTVCTGKGVIISDNTFGEKKYQSCYNCNGKGYVHCPLCHGTKTLEKNCHVCGGDGLENTNTICDHIAHEHN